jgi:uncharacterized protein YjbI with pentapeptide repeats
MNYIIERYVHKFKNYHTSTNCIYIQLWKKYSIYPISLQVIVLQNVELQNVELQNAEIQNIELQNAELQNAELQNIESYRTSNLTEPRNTKCRILQNVEIQNVDNTKCRKWQAWMVNIFWNYLFLSALRLKLNFTVHEYYWHCGPLPHIPYLTLT